MNWQVGRALLSCDDLSLSWRDAQHDNVYNTLFALCCTCGKWFGSKEHWFCGTCDACLANLEDWECDLSAPEQEPEHTVAHHWCD